MSVWLAVGGYGFYNLLNPQTVGVSMITTVVGSYPKVGAGPKGQRLRTAIARSDRGRITPDELRQVQDEVTEEVIGEQVEAGIDLVSDGQVRWDDGQTYFARGISGFTVTGLLRYFDTNTYYRQPVATDRLSRRGAITVSDYQHATACSTRPVKPVITGPYTLARLSRSEHHDDIGSMVQELAEVLNQEALELEKSGAVVIQFDEPAILQHPEDFPVFKEAMQRLTRGLTAMPALYTYFGDVGALYPQLFELPFHAFGLDFVAGRANWSVVREVPEGVCLGLGVVDARNTRLESVEELVEAVRWAESRVSLDRLYVNPSCGLEYLPRDRAYQKLVRLVEGVNRAKEVLE